MWYVYVIRNSINKRFYIGATKDIEKRIVQHNKSRRRSIVHFGNYELILKEEFFALEEARASERQIKSYKGGNAFKKLLHERAGLNI
jgi:putative endonuclease